MLVEIISGKVLVDIVAIEHPDCMDPGSSHWSWASPEWQYEDEECFDSREEAVVAGQEDVTYALKEWFNRD